ncbi:MAG: FGGY-family carbohydrate kinase [Christensenellales bacterium]|jgi:xylulokinase
MAQYVVGIDAGTTGLKTMIFDLNGTPLSHAYRSYPCTFPNAGWVEQDPWDLWNALCETSKEAIAKSGIDPREIGSIAISSQRGTFFAIDKDWNPIEDSIVWSDVRATKEAQWIATHFGIDKYYGIAASAMTPGFSYSKFKWVRDNRPDLYEKAYLFVNGQEWLLHQLGSEEVFTDPSSLAMNGMMDVAKLDWSDELLDAINVSREKLPPVKKPARQVGVVSAKAAELTGFAAGTPICVGGGDQQCAAVGSGIIKEGMTEITIGTAGVIVAAVDKVYPEPQHEIYFSGHANPGKWDMEGQVTMAASNLKWFRDTFCDAEAAVSKSTGQDVYDIICAEAANAAVGSRGLIYFPFLQGQLTPYYCDAARAGYVGITPAHGKPEMARAVLEGVAYELNMSIAAMQRVLGRPFDVIRLSGGGAKSPLWRQIQADVYGVPVEKLKIFDCSLVGAAILGATAVGIFSSVEEAVDSMVHTDGFVEPNMAHHEVYKEFYEIFRDAFLAWRDSGIYDRLAAAAEKHWNAK